MKPRSNISKLIVNVSPEEAAERLAQRGIDIEQLAKEIKAAQRERLFPGLQELIDELHSAGDSSS